MRKICALIMLAVLCLPGAAQAYYFEVQLLDEGSEFSYYQSEDAFTSGNMAQFMLSGATMTSGETGTLVALVTLFSDAGPGVFTDVDITLIDAVSIKAFYSDSLQATVSTHIYEPGGEGATTNSPADYSEDYYGPSTGFQVIESQQSHDLTFTTGVTYRLEMDFTSTFDDGGLVSGTRTLTLGVCCEECTPTPIPGAAWLLGSGLLGLAGLRKRFFA